MWGAETAGIHTVGSPPLDIFAFDLGAVTLMVVPSTQHPLSSQLPLLAGPPFSLFSPPALS